MDAVIDSLSVIGAVTGGLAAIGFAVMAVRQPAQRKGHLARAVFFGALALVMLLSM